MIKNVSKIGVGAGALTQPLWALDALEEIPGLALSTSTVTTICNSGSRGSDTLAVGFFSHGLTIPLWLHLGPFGIYFFLT